MPTKNSTLVQASKVLPVISPICGIHQPALCWSILNGVGKMGEKKCGSAKGAELEGLEDVLVIG